MQNKQLTKAMVIASMMIGFGGTFANARVANAETLTLVDPSKGVTYIQENGENTAINFNGNSVIIKDGSKADTFNIYIDTNRNGVVDAGENPATVENAAGEMTTDIECLPMYGVYKEKTINPLVVTYDSSYNSADILCVESGETADLFVNAKQYIQCLFIAQNSTVNGAIDIKGNKIDILRIASKSYLYNQDENKIAVNVDVDTIVDGYVGEVYEQYEEFGFSKQGYFVDSTVMNESSMTFKLTSNDFHFAGSTGCAVMYNSIVKTKGENPIAIQFDFPNKVYSYNMNMVYSSRMGNADLDAVCEVDGDIILNAYGDESTIGNRGLGLVAINGEGAVVNGDINVSLRNSGSGYVEGLQYRAILNGDLNFTFDNANVGNVYCARIDSSIRGNVSLSAVDSNIGGDFYALYSGNALGDVTVNVDNSKIGKAFICESKNYLDKEQSKAPIGGNYTITAKDSEFVFFEAFANYGSEQLSVGGDCTVTLNNVLVTNRTYLIYKAHIGGNAKIIADKDCRLKELGNVCYYSKIDGDCSIDIQSQNDTPGMVYCMYETDVDKNLDINIQNMKFNGLYIWDGYKHHVLGETNIRLNNIEVQGSTTIIDDGYFDKDITIDFTNSKVGNYFKFAGMSRVFGEFNFNVKNIEAERLNSFYVFDQQAYESGDNVFFIRGKANGTIANFKGNKELLYIFLNNSSSAAFEGGYDIKLDNVVAKKLESLCLKNIDDETKNETSKITISNSQFAEIYTYDLKKDLERNTDFEFNKTTADNYRFNSNDFYNMIFKGCKVENGALVLCDDEEDPENPTVDPENPTVDPENPTVDPENPAVDPENPTVDPENPAVKPENSENPADPADKPENPTENPAVKPEDKTTEDTSTTTTESQTVTTESQTTATTEDKTGDTTETPATPLKKGEKFTDFSNMKYEVTSKAGKTPTVALVNGSKNKSKSVVIPSEVTYQGVTYQVTEIGNKAFEDNDNIKTVVIPDSVKKIGKESFAFCGKLTKVTIGAGVEKIGAKAFYSCKALKKITVKTTKLKAKNIGKNAFKKAGSKNYKKLVVKVPKKKLATYKKAFVKKGLSKKATVK